MTINGEKATSTLRVLKFTCPECGSHSLFNGYAGYVCRQFIEAVSCELVEPKEKGDESIQVAKVNILPERLPDGSICVDYDEDNYSRSRHYADFFACADCEEVLRFEDGPDVQSDEELAEWLIENCRQDAPDEESLKGNDPED
jgi:predicted RNA-binding Zn-ribbon protein involved in translation (DUF1610 family)